MAHNTIKSSYHNLVDRLNRFPQGAPPADLLFKILKMLFSEKEAGLVSLMPIKPFTAEKASQIWNMDLCSTQKVLDELAGRAVLLDMEQNGQSQYCLPPPMAGFFEFSLMRVRDDIDQHVLSELFYEYLNVEEDFIRELFTRGETQLGRTFVHEPALSQENALHVLDYERATQVIEEASHRGVGLCYCRHKMEHMNRACDAPQDICMTFNTSAASLIKHGHARSIDKVEGLDLLQMAYESNLVQFGENVRKKVNFICNCCGCCCEAMIAARRFAVMNPVHTTNFLPVIREAECNGCGKCIAVCPVEAMTLVSANNPEKPRMKVAKLYEDPLSGLWGLRKSLYQRKPVFDIPGETSVNTPERNPQIRGDGHRTGKFSRFIIRQPGAVEPSCHGGCFGGYSEVTADQAGHGNSAGKIQVFGGFD